MKQKKKLTELTNKELEAHLEKTKKKNGIVRLSMGTNGDISHRTFLFAALRSIKESLKDFAEMDQIPVAKAGKV